MGTRKISQKGFSLTEVMIVMGIFVILMLTSWRLYDYMLRAKAITNLKAGSFMAVMKFAENIRYDASLYQINWNNLTAVSGLQAAASATGYSTLPYAILDNHVVKAADCPSCTTRLGLTITPTGFIRNLYEARIEVYDINTVGIRWGTSYYLTVQ